MKQSTYRKLFKRFWVLFLVPNLYGMEYGVVKHNINECCYGKTSGEQALVEVTKDALGIKNIHSPQEAIDTMEELFDAFNIRREKDEDMKTYLGGKNIAFYKGKAYINGFFPIDYSYDNLWLTNGKRAPYHVKQLYEVLGFNKSAAKKIEAIGRMSNNFHMLEKSVNYFPIQSFWDDIKDIPNTQISCALDDYRRHFKEWSHEYIKAAADYVISLRNLRINTKNLKLNSKNLDTSYYKATKKTQELFREYLKEFGKYIAYFNYDDSKNFLAEIRAAGRSQSALNRWIEIIQNPEYNRYTHTEYMIRYQHRNKSTPLYLISFNDVCKNCEQMLAETTPQKNRKINTVVVSAENYANSRSRNRLNHLTNFSFLQLQLHPKYFNASSVSNTNNVTHESWHRIDSNLNNAPWHNSVSDSERYYYNQNTGSEYYYDSDEGWI
ncbi:MAG: hypothetical protein K5780_01335 [Alphaproteobacteria bacterium]|nr:hypothetical protein [Alphaproteobacteria bacterium]